MNTDSRHPVAVVLGTRPEIIKLAHIIKLLGPRAEVIHTGQHYDVELSQTFFEAFEIETPSHVIGIGGSTRAEQIGAAVSGLNSEFSTVEPRAVVVQGDTNTTLAAALAANANEIPLVHVEAGLRSFDRRMPEEHNRVLTDHLADLCLAPTETSAMNLKSESVADERIVVTGNTVIEAVHTLLPHRDERRSILAEHGVAANEFVLSTFHRPENVDDPGRLETLLDRLAELPMPVVLPLHPRTKARAEDNGLWPPPDNLAVMPPIDYRQFLGLLAECALFVGDSGGVQEEVSVLKRPMLVIRRSTERPEVLGTFASLISDFDEIPVAADPLLGDTAKTLAGLREIPSPYGDGSASQQSVEAILRLLDTL